MSTLLHVEPDLNQALPEQHSPASQELPPSPLPNNEPAALPFIPDAISFGDPLSNASILHIDATSVAQGFDPLGIDLLSTSKAKASCDTPAFRGTESDHIAPEIQPFQLPSADHCVTAFASDKAMMDALLRGLGLPDLKINSTPVEFAETIGSMLRASTAGTMDIFKVHAITRHESRLNMSIIDDLVNKLANNPLNFFLTTDGALTHLLSNSQTNDISPAQAYINAFDDLKAHEIAIMAGVRAVLSDNIKTNTDDDFQRMFGDKFNQAYEEQMQKLSVEFYKPL